MASSFTIQVAPWPVGQSVSAYPAEAWPDPTRSPSGSAHASGTVTSAGTVTFDDLADDRRYVAYALTTGVRFATSTAGPLVPSSVPDRQRIGRLEEVIASGEGGGGGGGGFALIEDAETGYADRPELAVHAIWIGWTDPGPDGLGVMSPYDVFIPVPPPA